METVFATAVVGTGGVTLSTLMGQHYLSGWYFTETGGTNSITVTIRKDTAGGAILEKLTITAGQSVGEDYDHPLVCTAVHVTVAGTGSCQGHVRGR